MSVAVLGSNGYIGGMLPRALILLFLAVFTAPACVGTARPIVDPSKSAVSYVLRANIREGQEQTFRELMAEMVASTENEAGTVTYAWYLSEDGRRCHIHETFADTAAYRAHGDTFGARFADRFMPCIEIEGIDVYGNPDAEAREMLAGLDPTYYGALGGFER